MTDANMPKPPPPNEELRWYYQDSASDVGFHGQVLGDCGAGEEGPEPTERQIAKARDQARFKRALAELRGDEQSALEACYEHRQIDAGMAEYGIGAGAVARAVQMYRDVADQAERIKLKAAESCVMAEKRHERAKRGTVVAKEAHGVVSRQARHAAAEAARAWHASLSAAQRAKAAERAWGDARAKTVEGAEADAAKAGVMRLVCRAHDEYRAKRREQKMADFEVKRLEDEAKSERNQRYLGALRGEAELREEDTEAARLAAWFEEMGLA
jgi:hypothetical protein